MNYPSKVLEDAVESLSLLPGIGRKTALRLILHLLNDKTDKSGKISQALSRLDAEVKYCSKCHSISDHTICEICSSESRDKHVICVVENLRDLMAIEDTQQFNGTYHILGGVISPIDGIGPENLNIASLLTRVKEDSIDELIMAVSPTIDGETTIFYLSKLLKDSEVRISTIARGVAFGGELEYADEFTLGRSISKRLPYQANS